MANPIALYGIPWRIMPMPWPIDVPLVNRMPDTQHVLIVPRLSAKADGSPPAVPHEQVEGRLLDIAEYIMPQFRVRFEDDGSQTFFVRWHPGFIKAVNDLVENTTLDLGEFPQHQVAINVVNRKPPASPVEESCACFFFDLIRNHEPSGEDCDCTVKGQIWWPRGGQDLATFLAGGWPNF